MEKTQKQVRKKTVLMACSDLDRVKGGMVSVVKNILKYESWEEFSIEYIATHIEGKTYEKIWIFIKAYLKILMLISFGKVDLLHLHISERGSFYRKAVLLYLAKLFHKPVILHHHGAEFEMFYDELSEQRKKRVRRVLEKADWNILLSKSAIERLHEKAPGARCVAIHNGVEVQENLYQNGNYVITLGRLGKRKGTEDLLEAIRHLDKKLPESIHFYLCGDGEVKKVQKKVKEWKLEHRIAYVGWIDGEQKEELLKHACCHVLPSYKEVMPVSILETMARGIPNICTSVGSIPDIIRDGENGLLISPGDVKALEDSIWELCSNKKLCCLLSENAHKTAEKLFSIEAMGEKIKQLYRACLS